MLYEAYLAIVQFIELGGNVLYAIAFVTFVRWGLIFERVVFFTTEYRGMVRESVTSWEQRSERSSWGARQIRDGVISNAADKINGSFPVIQICVALCPLFGLLGTVTGMIAVFEAMATQGGNARSMAAGVSMATVPTMSGMVAALSGVMGTTYLQTKIKRETELFEDNLTLDH